MPPLIRTHSLYAPNPMITAHSDAYTSTPYFVDLPRYRYIDAFRCIADQCTCQLPHHTRLVSRSTSIPRSRVTHQSPQNNILHSFQRSKATGTSISTRSQRNDGITRQMFHRTTAHMQSRHYWYLRCGRWAFQHAFETCNRLDFAIFCFMLVSLTYYLGKLGIIYIPYHSIKIL